MATRKKSSPRKSADAADVDSLLAELQHPHQREILALRQILEGVDPAVRESVKWNAPSFYVSEHFATFHLRHKGGVQLVLHLGAKPRPDVQVRARIEDPESLLQWRGADRATVTFRDLAEIEARKSAFVHVLKQWIDISQGPDPSPTPDP